MSLYNVLGVMSGTSLDGIDIAYIQFQKEENWSFTIEKAETIPYTKKMQQALREAIGYDDSQLPTFDAKYTTYLAKTIQQFIEKHRITAVDAVCSHGHTIFHQPHKGITYQIGNQPLLADLLQQKVVCDFRVQDVALGGQGAPLVPIGDRLLFAAYDYCLNLGGFANVSYEENNSRIAFDICPVNIVLNVYANQLGFAYDDQGNLAKKGTYLPNLAAAWNALSFYKKSPPKSLGLEWVQEEIFPKIDEKQHTSSNILHTFTEHAAEQIAAVFKPNSKVLVTGGGAYNKYLLSRIRHHNSVDLRVPDAVLIEFKEALIFGFLGVLRLRNEVNCLQSVTAAKKDHCSGIVYEPS